MFSDDRLFEIAKAQHQYLLSKAEKERMVRLALSGRPPKKRILAQYARRTADWAFSVFSSLKLLRSEKKAQASTTAISYAREQQLSQRSCGACQPLICIG